MWKFCSLITLLLLCSAAFVAAQRSNNRTTSLWQTLSGKEPLVIARGGFSGIFPDSSSYAYAFAVTTGLPSTVLFCDVQLTSEGVGICAPDIRLDNSSNIGTIYQNRSNTYLVNGASLHGWFSIDFTLDDLVNVYLTQGIYSRSEEFDGTLLQLLTVQDVARQFRPAGYWLNVQHDAFYSQHNLSMRSFIIGASRSVVVNYISSPEVNFLRSIVSRFKPSPTKLVFRFLGLDSIEPSTNQTYSSLLRNLTFIKTFASGIMVPKDYIWRTNANLYLEETYTSIVTDAHREGLEIFASEFANDVSFAYNYSYDPVAEYLSFVDNGNFSVDGVLSDFPITPSEAIDCFSHMDKTSPVKVNVTVISREGASGDFPGCTNMAYNEAISDGADVIDCPVQISQDGIPFCLGSINLIDRTTVARNFRNLTISIAELDIVNGIFPFNFTWSQIQTLTPAIRNPFIQSRLYRNPRFQYSGKLVSLSEFLAIANNAPSVSAVLIGIENAGYLAEKQGLDVVTAVLDALETGGFNNRTAKKVMIESNSSSTLMKVKEKSNSYELVYEVDENIRDALNSTIMDIKKFADSVVIRKSSVFPRNIGFLTGATDVVRKLQSFDLPVYVELFSNEFLSQAWDFFSDAYVEINSFVQGASINGVITDFPKTAFKYKRNRCLGRGSKTPIYMSPVGPGQLFELIQPQPPAAAPNPVLTEEDVAEPPLPPVVPRAPPTNGSTAEAPAPAPPSGGQPKISAGIFLCNLAVLLVGSLLML